MKFSDLHKKLIEEGFEPLAMYHNSSFGSQEKSHTTPPLKQIIEERHIAFRIIPAHLAYIESPREYQDRHIIYIPEGTNSKLELIRGCEVETDI
ncbi:hypothetical protein J4221_01600 [Candidatus Pacearchaeota archaeon]|nr:hypothetical protein [Candidatus Pacearchaeota archaeon]